MAVTVTYLGHSGVLLSDGRHTLAIDPFLTGNPLAVHRPEDIACDFIALTHGHADHFGDTLAIAKRNGCPVIAAFEICNYVQEQGHDAVEPANPGGRVHTGFGYVAFTPAFHSSSYEGRYMGQPCGLVIQIGGIKLYHAGDTGLFSDMKLIGQLAQPRVAFLPVGDRFTMGPDLATRAAEFVGAPYAVPIHYKTWPPIDVDLKDFKPKGVTVKPLQPGETWTVD